MRSLLCICNIGNQISFMAMSRNKIQAILINEVSFECIICIILLETDCEFECSVCLFSLITNLLSFDSMLPFKFPLKVCTLPVFLLLKTPSDFVLTIEL